MLIVKCFVTFEGSIRPRMDELLMAVAKGASDPQAIAKARVQSILQDVCDSDIEWTIETCPPFEV